MGIFDRLKKFLRKIFSKAAKPKQPEDYYQITMTPDFVKVEHPQRDTEQINWNNIDEIWIVTTDEGPFLPDVWLMFIGKEQGCSIPWGAPKYDDVFEVVSKYEGFSFEEYGKAASSVDNAKFEVWKRQG